MAVPDVLQFTRELITLFISQPIGTPLIHITHLNHNTQNNGTHWANRYRPNFSVEFITPNNTCIDVILTQL